MTGFIVTNKRNPSRQRIEDHLLLNWLKQNRKLLNAGKMKEDRVGMFNKFLEMGSSIRGWISGIKKVVSNISNEQLRS